jgi:hypothetical protein
MLDVVPAPGPTTKLPNRVNESWPIAHNGVGGVNHDNDVVHNNELFNLMMRKSRQVDHSC